MKKIIKIPLIIIAVILIVLLAATIIFWESISIFRSNDAVGGLITAVPENQGSLIPITYGDADWPQWRGSNDARAYVEDFVTDWSEGLEKIWEVHYLCQGAAAATWSAPVIQGQHLVVTGRRDSSEIVFCLNAQTGSLIWERAYEAPAQTSYGTGARATPVIDEDRVYTFDRSGNLHCRNLIDGRLIWKQSVNDAGGEEHIWGHSSSPLIIADKVIVNGGGSARTIAYDKRSGKIYWKSGTGFAGYAAITSMLIEDITVVVIFHGSGLAGLNAETGEELWNREWLTNSEINCTTPVISGNKIFITSSYGKGGELLEVSKSEAEVLWTGKGIASHHTDPFIIDGYIYGYSGMSVQNRGSFKCLDLLTGEEQWSSNEIGWGTGLIVNDLLFSMDIKGNLYLVRMSPEKLELLSTLPKVFGKIRGAAWTMPVVANGLAYLRFKQQLICYRIGMNR
ncbi:PQQ-like beta-propeller repeat protein [bacterium]|nr:PQQ-like beta-propeller repeat protein [bacterium]